MESLKGGGPLRVNPMMKIEIAREWVGSRIIRGKSNFDRFVRSFASWNREINRSGSLEK